MTVPLRGAENEESCLERHQEADASDQTAHLARACATRPASAVVWP